MTISVSDRLARSRARTGRRPRSPGHVLQLYESDDFLHGSVARFIADGLAEGEPFVLFARGEELAGISLRLAFEGYDLDEVCEEGRLHFFDSRKTLAAFMANELPDATLFRRSVGGILAQSIEGSSVPSFRAYGDMVDILWQEGNPRGALRLEELWNDLLKAYDCSLLCGCGVGDASRTGRDDHFWRICASHTHVIPAEGYARARNEEERLREVARLQHGARGLELEIRKRRGLEGELREARAAKIRESAARKRSEAALRRAKQEIATAEQAKADFIQVMRHELRTPLNAIMGYEELLRIGLPGPVNAEQKEYLERIHRAAGRVVGLVDRVLLLSQLGADKEEPEIEPIDCAALAREIGALMNAAAASKSLTVRVDAPSEPMFCRTDARKLGQILLNLVRNALKFTDRGGVELSVRGDGSSIRFEVRDTGIGIDPGDLDRIFERFVQLDASPERPSGGTGLGLSVSRDLARALGGEITVESSPGVGSVFTVTIPVRPGGSDAH